MRPTAFALARGRAMNLENLRDTAVATIPAGGTDDGEGGETPGEPTELEFPCRISSGNGLQPEQVSADQIIDPAMAIMVYDYEVDLPLTATVQVTRSATGNVESYEVKGVEQDPTYVIFRRAKVRRITPDVEDAGS